MHAVQTYKNARGAGRRRILSEEQLSLIKQSRAEGKTVTALAKEYGVSRQTLSGYLNSYEEDASVCRTFRSWQKRNRDFGGISLREYIMRMDFMCGAELCTVLLVDFRGQKIAIKNQTMDVIHRAFGMKEKPGWDDFEDFLESRCFPESRDQIHLVLEDTGLDFYDPLSIVEKTKGRMAEDQQWLQITYYCPDGMAE
ncbi:MAG: Hin recombinase [Lachnospiraceae bacterium]|nr:Hin recombinase [Lachnospiraceae bacterium]